MCLDMPQKRVIILFYFYLCTSLLSEQDAPCSSCIFSVSVLESVISSRNPGPSHWRMILKTKIWVLGVLVVTAVSSLLDLLGRQSKEMYVCIILSINFSIHSHLTSISSEMNSSLHGLFFKKNLSRHS